MEDRDIDEHRYAPLYYSRSSLQKKKKTRSDTPTTFPWRKSTLWTIDKRGTTRGNTATRAREPGITKERNKLKRSDRAI